MPAPAYGGKAILRGSTATAPNSAPPIVHRMIAAGNSIQNAPYVRGGGHSLATGFDCSGMTSHILKEAGLLETPLVSRDFLNYGDGGPGRWVTIWASFKGENHVFMEICGLRIDTSGKWNGSNRMEGTHWREGDRSKENFVARHPHGL